MLLRLSSLALSILVKLYTFFSNSYPDHLGIIIYLRKANQSANRVVLAKNVQALLLLDDFMRKYTFNI